MQKINVKVSSETGKLNAVLTHTPGREVENVTPVNAERARYSDILNLNVVEKEYGVFRGVLQKYTKVFELKDLLVDILKDEESKRDLIFKICDNEQSHILDYLMSDFSAEELAVLLIEGIPLKKDNLTNFISPDRYKLHPLHNFFFMRDASISINNSVLISKMASKVRDREAIIMNSIFTHHTDFSADVVNPTDKPMSSIEKVTIEGGDIHVVSDKILLAGFGARTTTQGIDFVIDHCKSMGIEKHIIAQELPKTPESFIHLDMVFTLLGKGHCMVYKPVILRPHSFETVHIHVDNGKVKSISEEQNILTALQKLGVDLDPVYCGGDNEEIIQEREQWHSGANFFALEPGKVLGYRRNSHTSEALSKKGFEIIPAKDILAGKNDIANYEKCVVTIPGAELSRGGGGCRCMTMPVSREE